MRTAVKRTKVYKFDELPKKAQQNAITKHTDINTNYEWWDGEVDYFITEKWNLLGLKADASKICFSIDRDHYLYFPQNNLYVEDLPLFCKAIKNLVSKKVLKAILKEGNLVVSFPVTYYGGGSGTQTVSIESYTDDVNSLDCENAEKEIKEWVNVELLKPLWKAMFNAYFDLISDEAIAETLRINDYEFTEEGDIY